MNAIIYDIVHIFAVTILALIVFYYVRNYITSSFKYPPGPRGLPLVGYLPFMGNLPFKTFKDLSQKYGNIMGLRLGLTSVVVLNDYQSIKEAFNNYSILHRPPDIFYFHPGNLGFSAASGKEWMEQRRYMMRALKEFGLGNLKWEQDLEDELDEFIRALSEHEGRPLDVLSYLSASVANNITSLVFGKRIGMTDVRRKIVEDAIDALAIVFNQAGSISFFPRIAKLLAKMGILELGKELTKMEKFNKLMREEVETRAKNLVNEEEVLIDGYLKEIQKSKENNIQNTFSVYNLVGNCQSLTHGGSETTRTSLLWLYLAMASYPKIQMKIYEEINRVLGQDGTCNWSKRGKLPYTYATCMEAQRWRTVGPLGLSHRSSQDTTIGDFHISKGTVVIPNIWALHNDTKYWSEPETFDPERFLFEDGSLVTKNLESYAPFSLGRRVCPGASIAMMEIFKYFTTTVQKFDILPLEDQAPNLDGYVGVTYYPHPQKLRFIPRE